MDYSAWQFWLNVAQWICTLLLGIYVWQATRHRITNQKIEKLKEEVDCEFGKQTLRTNALGDRMTRVEADIRSLPDYDKINELSGRIERLNGLLSNLSGRLEGINRAVDLIMASAVEKFNT